MTRLVILDNEAVQALRDPAHPKHRVVVSHAQVIVSRKRRAAVIELVVPTAVRVEAGWDRTSSAWVFPNRLRIADIPLGTANASTAAAIRNQTGVSVADAHLGAVIQSAPADQITVVTSDPGDMRLVAGDRNVTVAAIWTRRPDGPVRRPRPRPVRHLGWLLAARCCRGRRPRYRDCRVTRPVLVGWSHGATTAVRYAAQHRGQVAGLVLIDGGFPIAMLDEKARQAARAQFRRLGLLMRIAAAAGRGAQLTPDQAADVVIEMDAINGELATDFKVLDWPATFILGTGGQSGAPAEEMRTLRASAAVAQAASQRVSVFATAPYNHTAILRKCPDLVVAAIKDVAGTAWGAWARRYVIAGFRLTEQDRPL